MTVTYDPSNLDKDTPEGQINIVRFLLGDTNVSDANLQDEEISFAITASGNSLYNAASMSASVISAKYAGYVDTEIDGVLQASYSELSDSFRKLAVQLKQDGYRLDGASLGIYLGGASSDPTSKDYAFYRGQFENE